MSEHRPLIELDGIVKTFPGAGAAVTVLHGVSLTIHEGEFVAIIGASGSGKSTLMNLIGCLDRPTSGSYRLAGQDVAGLDDDRLAALRRDTFGFIFQRYNLIANASAAENVEMPAMYAGLPAAESAHRARRLLGGLGLDGQSRRWPNQLSGGEQQRVSIARALMNGGRVILADEPTGALDSRNGAEVMKQLLDLHRAGHTLVLVTHDPQLAALAERRVEIKDGRIVADSGPAAPQGEPQAAVAAASGRPGRGALGDLRDAIKVALRALRANVFRTALTLLGIIIGVGSVVTMVALGEGSKREVLARLEAMGTDVLVVKPGKRNVRTKEEKAALVAEDAEALESLPNVLRVAPQYDKAVVVRAGPYDYTTTCVTTSGSYAAARNWPLARGAFFSDADVDSYAPVAVLGRTVAEALFPDDDPIGRNLLINNITFQVVGVLAAKGASAAGDDMDDAVFVPLTTGRMRLFGKRYVHSITVQVADVGGMDQTAKAIRTLLGERHNKENFQVRNMGSLKDTAAKTQDTLTLLLSSVAAISLLVGGIGVMNIMLVSVTERVREIGVRMAVGARVSQVLMHFITEALVVCSVGGAIGVGVGLGAALAAERLFGMPVVYSAWSVLAAFGSAMATGLLFGLLPARRAARQDPVAALAAE